MVEALPVAKDPTGESGLIMIPIKEMIFLEGVSAKKHVEVHTLSDKGYMNGTITFWLTALTKEGYNFRNSYRDLIVNLDNVEHLDKFRKNVYFQKEKEINKQSKKCPIASGATFEEFVKELLSFKPQLSFI
jgi:DNA-binding LytR/AlgR family response regulator